MSEKCIYIFKDAGYAFGAKIGRGVKSNLQSAQSFAPRSIDFLAAWSVPANDAPAIEVDCTAGLPRFLPDGLTSETTRSGREWFALQAQESVDLLTRFFRRRPDQKHWKAGSTVDVYQSPLSRPGRMMIFVHEEYLTGRLKAHAISEWQSPLEKRRRYSRNGFAQLMAFTYAGEQCSLESNKLLIERWRKLFTDSGIDPTNSRGWLPAKISQQQVRDFFLRDRSIYEIKDITSALGRPQGVRTRYNASESIPTNELALFKQKWWS